MKSNKQHLEDRRIRLVYMQRCWQWTLKRRGAGNVREWRETMWSLQRLEDLECAAMGATEMRQLMALARATFAAGVMADSGHHVTFAHDGSWGEDCDDLPF